MNLDLSLVGWLHSLACVLALVLGPAGFFQRKGSAAHIAFGRAYLATMLVVNVTAFGIYRRHMFWFPHWFAVAALASIAMAYAAVRLKRPRRLWIHLHLSGMLASYYVLVGGGVNEVCLRIDALAGVARVTRGATIGLTHLAAIIAFVALIAAMNTKFLEHRKSVPAGRRDTPALGVGVGFTPLSRYSAPMRGRCTPAGRRQGSPVEVGAEPHVTAVPTEMVRVSDGTDGQVRLSIHHAGLGWLSFVLSVDQAKRLAEELTARSRALPAP